MKTIAEINQAEDQLKAELLSLKNQKEELSKSLEGLKEVYEGKYFKENHHTTTIFYHIKKVNSKKDIEANVITVFNTNKIELAFKADFFMQRNVFEVFEEEIKESEFLEVLELFGNLALNEYPIAKAQS